MVRFLEGEWHFLLTGLRQIITALVWYPFSFHFKDKFRGLKTAPEDSLTFFLAVCVCIVYHSYGGENICAEHVHRLFFEMATTLSLPSTFLLIVEIKNQSVHDVQSQQRNRSVGANENSKQKHVNCLKHGKTRVFKLWFALVFHLIDWENSAGFLDQSQYEEKIELKQYQIFLDTQLNIALNYQGNLCQNTCKKSVSHK